MKDLFGMCIDNTSQIAQTIGVTLSINDTMKKITGLMGQEEDQQEQKPNASDLLQDIGDRLAQVKQEFGDYVKKIETRPKMWFNLI
jgi:predicted enzyme related to lactoylglutathione lyase